MYLRTVGRGAYTTPNAIHLSRRHSSKLVLHIPRANVYRFDGRRDSSPVFKNIEWSVRSGEAWAVMGTNPAEKSTLFETLLGRLKMSPYPPNGPFPSIGGDPYTGGKIGYVAAGNRSNGRGGAFYDYSARYGHVHEEDKITLRQSMFPETMVDEDIPADIRDLLRKTVQKDLPVPDADKLSRFKELSVEFGLDKFLDLPIIALSNGQTRRARILKAILSQPQLLLLDEPLTGLDKAYRPAFLQSLIRLHEKNHLQMILGLRLQDELPEWISHIAFLKDNTLITGKHDVMRPLINEQLASIAPAPQTQTKRHQGGVLVDLKNVSVQYSSRVVLNKINWEIREGDIWHLQGVNGSGKTTLLSLLTGDHPQSYTQRGASHLKLFGKLRHQISTPVLQSMIGHASPEIFDAFPRRPGMTVRNVVATGFDGTFTVQGKQEVGVGVLQELTPEDVQERLNAVDRILESLGPQHWSGQGVTHQEWAQREFKDLSNGEQRMALLMRALVGKPKLLLLDEVWSGMTHPMVEVVRRHLTKVVDGIEKDQAIVVISHWESELPWTQMDGVKKFLLASGEGKVQE